MKKITLKENGRNKANSFKDFPFFGIVFGV